MVALTCYKFYSVKVDLFISTKSALCCISLLTFETTHTTMSVT